MGACNTWGGAFFWEDLAADFTTIRVFYKILVGGRVRISPPVESAACGLKSERRL